MSNLEFHNNPFYKYCFEFFDEVFLFEAGKYNVGDQINANLRGQDLGTIEVVAQRKLLFQHISDVLSFRVCGKPAAHLAGSIKLQAREKVDGNTQLVHVVFQYAQRNISTHQVLLKEWWDGINSTIQNTDIYDTSGQL